MPVDLDDAECRAVATALGVRWRGVFEGLRILEDEWLTAQSEHRQ